jgi:uncharacterized Fe-S cluster-containing protein
MRHLNKIKLQALGLVRFKCNNTRCDYQLTYEELLLGTHELDECQFLQVVCEGCGTRIIKQEQIKHESLDCEKPLGKCSFCHEIYSLREMQNHIKSCSLR